MLLIDNDDCFIHTLANYARQTGAEVVTYRSGFPLELIEQIAPDLILISPGPGRPRRFRRARTVRFAAEQAHSGLRRLSGSTGNRRSVRRRTRCSRLPDAREAVDRAARQSGVFRGLAGEFQVGRYHSFYALREKLPSCLEVTGGVSGRSHHGCPPPRAPD